MAMAKCWTGSSGSSSFLALDFSAVTRSPCYAVDFLGGNGRSASSTTLSDSNSPKSIHLRRGPSKLAVGVRCEAGSGTGKTAWTHLMQFNFWISGKVSTTTPTEWFQKTVELPGFKRGCHIITQHIKRAVPEISEFQVGIAHIFVMHTSASLTINENASSDVPLDMEDSLNRIVPEGHHYRHLDEGLDDMPAHVKASMMGSSLSIPIKAGRLHLGIWQGIWLNEHRNYGGGRSVCITIQGQKRSDGRTYR